MKKFALICALMSLSCGFVACSDDSDGDSKGGIGDSCKQASECASNYCDTETSKCADKPADQKADGAEGGKCLADDKCNEGLVCNDKKICEKKTEEIPDGAEGGKCSADDKCNEGLVCNDKKICEKKTEGIADGAKGGKCLADDKCNKGLVCNAETKVCEEKTDQADNPCKGKNEGDACGDGGKVCNASGECVDAVAGCTKASDCSGEFNLCDTDAKKCYKVNATYKLTCETSGANPVAYTAEWLYKDNSKSKIIKEECKGDKPLCNEAKGGCIAATGEVECNTHDDCINKDATKPYCDGGVCVAKLADPCEKVKCNEGTCDRGICVTEAMKKLKADGTETCNDADFQSFCNGDKAVECANNKVVADDCKTDKIGSCTVVENFGEYTATCSGDEKAIAICEANESSATPAATVNVCYGTQNWSAKVLCAIDVFGKMAMVVRGTDKDCIADGKVCAYDDADKPICKQQ